MPRGGARPGAGRKRKDEEHALVEKLSAYDDVWFEKIAAALASGERWAMQLFANYRWGKPIETQNINLNEEQPLFPDVHSN